MARLFDGSSDYLTVDTAAFTAAPFTMEVMARRDGTGVAGVIAWVGDKDSDTNHWEMRIDAVDKVRVVAHDGSESSVATSATMTQDVWFHAAYVAESASSRHGFLDGTSKVTDTTSTSPSGADRTAIGRNDRSSPRGHGRFLASTGALPRSAFAAS